MNISSENKARSVWAGVGLLVIAILLVAPGLTRSRYFGRGNRKDLKHFHGVLDESKTTFDHVRSDLDVQAGKKLEAGDAQGAEALYRQVIRRYPKDPGAYEALAACLMFQSNHQAAAAEYGRALEIDSRSVDALYGLACIAYDETRYDEARERLEKAVSIAPDHALCHRLLGYVYEQMSEKGKAIAHYQRAVDLDPADGDIKRRLTVLKATP